MKTSLKASDLEYQTFFDTMIANPEHQSEIEAAIAAITKGKSEYILAALCNKNLPWYAIGIAHYMEGGCDFNTHIHCGDSLKKRTIHEPKGRPIADPINGKGKPYTWEESCLDWLIMKGWSKWKDWEVVDILARLEANNGMGYRQFYNPSPYLWSFTNIYNKGKYESDGSYNPELVSKQVGAAILLKHFTQN